MDFLSYGLIALAAYLLGSIPTGFLVAKARGIDIRTVGSGNIGATNALRVLGKPAGITVLLVDALKGWLAVAVVAPLVLRQWSAAEPTEDNLVLARIIATLCAVLGHNYTCWLGGKGGKGIATSAGVLTALVPWSLLIILAVFIVLTFVTRFVSVGSVAASLVLPFATWFTTHNWTLTAVTGAMGLLAIFKHKGNIQRLLNGTEPRIGAAKAARAEAPAEVAE